MNTTESWTVWKGTWNVGEGKKLMIPYLLSIWMLDIEKSTLNWLENVSLSDSRSLSVSVSPHLCLFLPLSMPVSVSSVSLSLSLCFYHFLYLSLSMSLSLSVCLSLNLFVSVSLSVSVALSLLDSLHSDRRYYIGFWGRKDTNNTTHNCSLHTTILICLARCSHCTIMTW